MNVWLRILVAVLLAAALAVSSPAGDVFFSAASVVVVLCISLGWPILVASSHLRTATVMTAVIGLLGLASVRVAEQQTLLWLSVLAGLGLLATYVSQLVLGPDENGVTILVASQMTGIVIVLAACAWPAAVEAPGHSTAVIAGAVALACAIAVTMIRWPAVYTSPLAVLVGAASAAAVTEITAVAGMQPAIPLWIGIVLGAVLGVLVAAVHRLLGMENRPRRSGRRQRAGARPALVELGLGAVPIGLGGALVYIAERLFIG